MAAILAARRNIGKRQSAAADVLPQNAALVGETLRRSHNCRGLEGFPFLHSLVHLRIAHKTARVGDPLTCSRLKISILRGLRASVSPWWNFSSLLPVLYEDLVAVVAKG
jgi:hypothetical protein